MNKRLVLGIAGLLGMLTALAWVSAAHEGEHHSPGGNGQPNDQPLFAMAATPCVGGMAFTFPCSNVDLLSLLPIADIDAIDGPTDPPITSNEVWGWTDPQTGKEYAIIGLSNGLSFVDVSSPEAAVYLGHLPAHGVNSLWRSLKVYRNHVFAVSEAANHGMQIFDLTQLRSVTSPQTFTETHHYNRFTSAHTLAINEETGFAYAAGSRPVVGGTHGVNTCNGVSPSPAGGLHVIDIKNPSAPVFSGCVNEDGYTHETQCVVYRGPDAPYRDREICFSANEDTVTIVDVTNKSNPVQLSRTGYAGRVYTHQGWLTEDHRTLLVNDELDEHGQQNPRTKTFVWDVTDLDAPLVRNVHQHNTTAIDHNLYVRGRYVFESNYRSGLRILDAANANSGVLSEVGFFDVYPTDDQPMFNGTWHNYPFFASGTIVVAGMEQGLFVLRPRIDMPIKIDYSPFFVRRHYLDFLGREPDESGLGFWTHGIARCVDAQPCTELARINVSTAFFLSIEFQNTGYLIHRFHTASFPGSLPRFTPFIADLRRVGDGVVVGATGWQQRLDANKVAFSMEWVQRSEFVSQFPLGMGAADYVDALFRNAGASATPAERDAGIAAYGGGNVSGRASALRTVVESGSLYNRQYNSAFVMMQYFGYLGRDPDSLPDSDYSGYQFWLDKLDSFSFPGEDMRDPVSAHRRVARAEMVRAFISSIEYRARFGQ